MWASHFSSSDNWDAHTATARTTRRAPLSDVGVPPLIVWKLGRPHTGRCAHLRAGRPTLPVAARVGDHGDACRQTAQEGAAIDNSAPQPAPEVVARLRAAGCVFAEEEARLITTAARTAAEVDAWVDRRAAGEPLEHLLGWVQFCGLRLAVAPGVFVPRRRTELLARLAATLLRSQPCGVVVDLCCGCGAVAAAVAVAAPGVEVHAVDIDAAAVECAGRNLARAAAAEHNPGNLADTTAAVAAAVYRGDLYEPLPERLRGRVTVLVANAPYVPTGALELMPPEARLHEPRAALDGGPDGLDIVRRVATEAPRWLAPLGHLLVETSQDQAPAAVELLTSAGLAARVARSEELDATAVVASRPA